MFEHSHAYGKFILRAKSGAVYDELPYNDSIPGSMDRAREAADAWVERMNKLWNRKAA